jgi:uncharacterized OsmC-like protein
MSEHRGQRVHIVQKDGYLFETTFEAAPDAAPVLADEPPPLGASRAPTAAGLLAAAVGNCLSASLYLCLQKSRASVCGITTDVTVHVERNEKGRLRIAGLDVEVVPTLGAEDVAKLERCSGLFEDFCTVTASIEQGIPVNVTLKRA